MVLRLHILRRQMREWPWVVGAFRPHAHALPCFGCVFSHHSLDDRPCFSFFCVVFFSPVSVRLCAPFRAWNLLLLKRYSSLGFAGVLFGGGCMIRRQNRGLPRLVAPTVLHIGRVVYPVPLLWPGFGAAVDSPASLWFAARTYDFIHRVGLYTSLSQPPWSDFRTYTPPQSI